MNNEKKLEKEIERGKQLDKEILEICDEIRKKSQKATEILKDFQNRSLNI